MNESKFCKVRFTSTKHGETASLVLPENVLKNRTVTEISQYFPMFEAMKMEQLWISRAYDSFDSAFNADW